MVSPLGIVPESLILPAMKAEAIVWLNNNVSLLELRRYILLGWAEEVGATLSAKDFVAIGFPEPKITGE